MPQENTPEEIITLGSFLREKREKKGVSIRETTEITKISAKMLEAIENDDYATLPAEAFSRGFYSMYAEFLELDPADILNRYQNDRGLLENPINPLGKPPTKRAKAFSDYAEPASFSSFTTAGITIAAALIGIVAICWFLNWNPVTYISTKLQNMKNFSMSEQEQGVASPMPPSEPSTEASPQENNSTPEPEAVPPALSSQEPPPPLPLQETEPEPAAEPPKQFTKEEVAAFPDIPYLLEAKFNQQGTLKITLDDGFIIEKSFAAGEPLQWEASNKIILALPEEISGSLQLNGITIPLPEATDGERRLSLPEDLLD